MSKKSIVDHDKHWQDMPEFVQEKKEAFAKIIIRVDSQEDLDELSRRLEQPFTQKTKSAWFPHRPHQRPDITEWVDEK